LTLADFIGLDVCVAILDVLYDGLGDPKYRACPLLRRMVAAGHLGRKTGRGFHVYDAVRPRSPNLPLRTVPPINEKVRTLRTSTPHPLSPPFRRSCRVHRICSRPHPRLGGPFA
jgi:3-hydroxyacyl-CoA dehydrogenase